MGPVRQGAVRPASGMPGCHEANGKCGQHDGESGDPAPPSLGAPGSRTSPRTEGSSQRHPYLALEPSPPLGSRPQSAAAASRAARLRFLIGSGRPLPEGPARRAAKRTLWRPLDENKDTGGAGGGAGGGAFR